MGLFFLPKMVTFYQAMGGAVHFKVACKINGPYFASQIDSIWVVMLLKCLPPNMYIVDTLTNAIGTLKKAIRTFMLENAFRA